MKGTTGHTDEWQPFEVETKQSHNGQQDPQQRLRVYAEPEESAIGRVYHLGARLAALEDPM